jgi:hypothetical protein
VPDSGDIPPFYIAYADTLPPQLVRGLRQSALAPTADMPRERMRASFAKIAALVPELAKRNGYHSGGHRRFRHRARPRTGTLCTGRALSRSLQFAAIHSVGNLESDGAKPWLASGMFIPALVALLFAWRAVCEGRASIDGDPAPLELRRRSSRHRPFPLDQSPVPELIS